MKISYVHGYDPRENIRLQDQASTLVELLHSDTSYPTGSSILEAGCGIGAQTVTLARNSPNALITSVDISEASIIEARRKVTEAGLTNVQFQQAGFRSIRVSPRMVYVDSSKPEFVEGFTKKTFTAMIEGVRESAIKAGMIDQHVFEEGIRDLYRTTELDGVFCYTFFKALGEKPYLR
jgi:cyclopropane fatty-acyl-phospholipid synthase-like methyltransferase